MLRGGLPIASQDDGVQACAAQLFDHEPRLRSNIVAKDNATKQRAFCDPYFGKAGFSDWDLRHGNGASVAGKPIAPAKQTFLAVTPGTQTLAGDGFKLFKFDRSKALLLAVTGNRTGEGVGGKTFKRIS